MPFIPNELDAFHPSQSSPDSGHFEVLRAGPKATGVVSGGAVTAQGTPDMTVAVASAVIAWEGTKANVAAGNLTLTADGTDPRFYLIVASSAGVKSAVAGAPAPEMDDGVRGPAFPAIPATSVVLASVYVPAADTDIDANQIDDMRVFVVPPEPTTNYDLAKARSIPLVKERSQTVALDSGQNLVHASALANGKLFLSGQTSPAWFVRCNNLEDLTDRTSFNFASDGFHVSGQSMTYVAETNKLYVLFNNSDRVFVSSVDPATHAVVDVINDTANIAGTNGAICSDGTNLYVATYTVPAKVLKYRLSDFSLQGTATLANGTGHSILYDGTDLFVTGPTSPGWVARVNPSTMTVGQEATFASGVNIATDDLASVGDSLWVGVEVANNINVLRIAKSDLTQTKAAYGFGAVVAVHYDGEYVWTAASSLYRIDPLSFDAVEFTSPSTTPNEILSDGTGRLFVTTYTSPTNVSRFAPSIFTTRRIGAPVFPVGGSIDTVLPMGKRFIDSTTRTTSGTSEATLGQMSVAGDLLSVNGMMLRVTVAGSCAANANNKRIAIRLDASNYMFDTGLLPFNDARWKFMLEIIRTGASTQDWSAFFISDSSVLPTDVQFGTTAFNLANLAFMAVRAQTPTAAGDVTQEHYMVEVIS